MVVETSEGPALYGRPLAAMGGGAVGNRTPDLYNAIVALSQLSYGPERIGPARTARH